MTQIKLIWMIRGAHARIHNYTAFQNTTVLGMRSLRFIHVCVKSWYMCMWNLEVQVDRRNDVRESSAGGVTKGLMELVLG